ncbi:MAG: hypothetical protein K0R28_6020 [Paenibacillus sp.]|nr:hypothetical protein [Paenibacillus sp.]
MTVLPVQFPSICSDSPRCRFRRYADTRNADGIGASTRTGAAIRLITLRRDKDSPTGSRQVGLLSLFAATRGSSCRRYKQPAIHAAFDPNQLRRQSDSRSLTPLNRSPSRTPALLLLFAGSIPIINAHRLYHNGVADVGYDTDREPAAGVVPAVLEPQLFNHGT